MRTHQLLAQFLFRLFEVFPRESGRARCGANQVVCQLGALFGVREEGVRDEGVRDFPIFWDYRLAKKNFVPNSDSRLPHKFVFHPTNTSWTTQYKGLISSSGISIVITIEYSSLTQEKNNHPHFGNYQSYHIFLFYANLPTCQLFTDAPPGGKNKSAPNLRIYRGKKVRKGRRSIRRKRYRLQPLDVVSFRAEKYVLKGTHGYGSYVRLISQTGDVLDGKAADVTPLRMKSGIYIK